MVVSSKSCKFRPNRWFFVIFYEMSHFYHLFAEKLTKTLKHGSLIENLQALGKSMIFRDFDEMSHFLQLFAEELTKTPKHGCFLEKLQVLAKWMIFRSFSRNEPLFATFCWKADQTPKHGCFLEKLQVLAKWIIFQQKVSHFVKKHKKSSIWPNLTTSEANYDAWAFWWAFQQKVEKSGSFLEKEPKILHLAKTCNFSRKQPCFGVLVIFSGKSCKKWLISSTSTKNHWFGQNLQLFDETTLFRRFGHFFRKKLQRRAHFVKEHEKSSIWPKLSTLRGNYHVSAFWSIFQQKVGKSGSFREKERNIIDFAKSCNFSSKLPCFRVLVNFSAKRWKKWLISWKNDEKSSIWPKHATFRENSHVSAFWSNFQQKVAKSASFCEGARKIIDLANTSNFSSKLPCFSLLVNFSAKSESFREKARKIIDLAKTNNFSIKLPCFGVLVSFSAKSCKKYCRSISGTSYNYGVRDLNLLLSPLPRLR